MLSIEDYERTKKELESELTAHSVGCFVAESGLIRVTKILKDLKKNGTPKPTD